MFFIYSIKSTKGCAGVFRSLCCCQSPCVRCRDAKSRGAANPGKELTATKMLLSRAKAAATSALEGLKTPEEEGDRIVSNEEKLLRARQVLLHDAIAEFSS